MDSFFAEKIAKELKTSQIYKCRCAKLKSTKPRIANTYVADKEAYANKGLILVDDVLNSGTTLIYAIRHF
jgi:pyrimidine operon attenuation protein/uracil phosphoribosyltransferase